MTLIIGGGGAGLHYAKLLKEKHPEINTTIIEEHKDIGKPIQCTGILTDEITKILPKQEIEKFTLNKITKTRVYSQNNHVDIPINTNYIICNITFIKYLHEQAEKQGVNIKLGKRYLKNEGKITTYRDTETKKIEEIKFENLIGADGPASAVARNNNLMQKRKYLTGVQARIKLKDFDKEKIDFYPYIGEYAWFTPESDEIARIGVAAETNAKKIFDDFIKKYPGQIIEMQGGPIPMHKPKTPVQNKKQTISLLGDAALQIKNTTGGGIIPGLKAAEKLSESTEKYQKNLKTLNLELYAHYKINKILKQYNQREWDTLIKKVNTPKIKEILQKTNRDKPIKMLLKLATQPKIIMQGLKDMPKILK
ncbi:NAD(P)/FAD-dependent oxidoreductase [Candidatus Woesearchaeota archaeon]|nr:NAD(P)/FAD-dependent oxidoreductase [Candidatus Woesearchaeota archaeon]